MAIEERIITYSVRVDQTDLGEYTRLPQLRLESGTVARLEFDPQPPADGVRFAPGLITISMTEDQFADAYQMLLSEQAVFCTAINLFGIRVGAVHTKLDLSLGDPATLRAAGERLFSCMSSASTSVTGEVDRAPPLARSSGPSAVGVEHMLRRGLLARTESQCPSFDSRVHLQPHRHERHAAPAPRLRFPAAGPAASRSGSGPKRPNDLQLPERSIPCRGIRTT